MPAALIVPVVSDSSHFYDVTITPRPFGEGYADPCGRTCAELMQREMDAIFKEVVQGLKCVRSPQIRRMAAEWSKTVIDLMSDEQIRAQAAMTCYMFQDLFDASCVCGGYFRGWEWVALHPPRPEVLV